MPKFDYIIPHEFEDKNRKVRWYVRVKVEAYDPYEARKIASRMLLAAEERILGGYEDGNESLSESLPADGGETGTGAEEADGQGDVRGNHCSFLDGNDCRLHDQMRKEANPVF